MIGLICLTIFTSAIIFTKMLIEKGDIIASIYGDRLPNQQSTTDEPTKPQEPTFHTWINDLHG